MKTCFKCGIQKEIDCFYAHPEMKDGHLGKCKECCKMDDKLRRIEHPERLAAYEKSRDRIKYATERTKKWREKNPEKYRAHNILYAAVRDKKIVKPLNCEVCGNPGYIHAHHTDYSQPLLVVWMCARCHGQIQ